MTEFFRDKREFEVLETQVIPRIFEDKAAGQQVRVWVLGCATGEEAYSIGILLREHMSKLELGASGPDLRHRHRRPGVGGGPGRPLSHQHRR